MVDNTEQDDEIIELTQVLDENLSHALDQDVIELTDIDTQTEEPAQTDPDLDFDIEMGLERDHGIDLETAQTAPTDSEKENEGVEPVLTMASEALDTNAPVLAPPISGGPGAAIESTVTQEQVDAALERVIEKKFAKHIDKILFEVMETVLEKEIVDIRNRLQKDLDEITNS